jgi:hypothetical protein
MRGQWHTGHGMHVSKHGTAKACQKRQGGGQECGEETGKFYAGNGQTQGGQNQLGKIKQGRDKNGTPEHGQGDLAGCQNEP